MIRGYRKHPPRRCILSCFMSKGRLNIASDLSAAAGGLWVAEYLALQTVGRGNALQGISGAEQGIGFDQDQLSLPPQLFSTSLQPCKSMGLGTVLCFRLREGKCCFNRAMLIS